MNKLIVTTFAACLALGSAGAFAQANPSRDSTKTTDGMAKESMNKDAIDRKDAARSQTQSPSGTMRQGDPTVGSKNTTDGMAKESMNKEAIERKDAANRMQQGQGKPTAAQEKRNSMQADPMKKDDDGMKK